MQLDTYPDITFQLKYLGSGIDITGSTVYFAIKTNLTDSDANAKIFKTVTSHSDPLNGKTTIVLTDEDWINVESGNYWYGIKIKFVDNKKVTPFYGNCIIIKNPIQI